MLRNGWVKQTSAMAWELCVLARRKQRTTKRTLTLCSTTSDASMPIVVWKPWEELGAKLVQFRWLVELARAAWTSWTRARKASRRSKPTMAWESEDVHRAVSIVILVDSHIATATRISKKSQVTSNHGY